MGPHHEQTEASLAFEGSRIYIRAEQFLYCVEDMNAKPAASAAR